MAHLSDREISDAVIESCRLGDRDAFRVLYDIYKDHVYSISLYYFHGDQAIASDITQQIFLKLLTSIGQFRGGAEFSTWLYRLAVNTCTDAARRRKSDAVMHPVEELAAPCTQEEDFARAQMADSVRAGIAALPPKFRMAVLLRHFEDFSYEQMAQVLNCSMGTVASRLSRGHRLLADRLKGLRGI